MRVAQRTLAECTQFFVRAVRRNSGNFANFFARFQRKVCVISTPDARLFGCQRTHNLAKSIEDVMRIETHAGQMNTTFCARGALKIFENFPFFRAILAQHSRDLDAEHALFRIGTHCRLGQLQIRLLSMRSLRWPNARSFCARGAPDFRKFCNFFARL